jgi:SPP1 gp7 family putative phage head morphogenesis protein
MKFIKPQRLRPQYYEQIEKSINDYLYELLFRPIIAILKDNTKQQVLLNAPISRLLQAIRNGSIQYYDGIFSGKFNAAIGKELRDIGAAYDHRANVYRLDSKLIPPELLVAAQMLQDKAKKAHEALKRFLDEIEGKGFQGITLPSNNMVNKVAGDFRSFAKDYIVTPQLTDQSKKLIADNYNNNMNLYIKDWKTEQIKRLRSTVEENSIGGFRFDNLISRVQEQYSTTQAKAKFLARQETALFMSNYRKERFTEAGVRVYKWSARGPSLTRPDHWRLNGKFFEYNNPPIVDLNSGRHGNPGTDYGCLCVDIASVGYQGKVGL